MIYVEEKVILVKCIILFIDLVEGNTYSVPSKQQVQCSC